MQYAETAYLAEDVPLALKTFLHAVDMTDDDGDGDLPPRDTIPTGLTLRAWFGVKLVSVVFPLADTEPQPLTHARYLFTIVHSQDIHRPSSGDDFRVTDSSTDLLEHPSCGRALE